MSRIKLEKTLPLPEPMNRSPDLPLADMEVGHHFQLKNIDDKTKAAIRQKIRRYQVSNPPKVFRLQTVAEGTILVFRMKDQ